ncbi:MAG: P1 family peptidase [Hyphomicrobiales bacterium]
MKSELDILQIGHAEDAVLRSGVSVILCDRPALAAVHVMGAAPGTRETELLAPENLVSHIDAIVLSGGSVFGLDAASGVVEVLRAHGRGYKVGSNRMPIVPAAILYDLSNGGDKSWEGASPYLELGRSALRNVSRDFQIGGVGAGFGATTANLRGGFGYAETQLSDGVVVCAFVAVNAVGQVTMGDSPNFWATPFELGAEFGGLGFPQNIDEKTSSVNLKNPGNRPLERVENTTVGVIATNAKLNKSAAKRLAMSAHDGYAHAIWPCHTPMDGDLIFALSTEEREVGDLMHLNAAATSAMARAIAIGVYSVKPRSDDTKPAWQSRFGDIA